MSSVLFIALPLLFSFSTPFISKIGKNSIIYTSIALQSFLLYIAFSFFSLALPQLEIIAIAPPLGISLVVTKASLLFVILFIFISLIITLFYFSNKKEQSYNNEAKFFILLNMLLASSIGLVLSADIFNIYVFFEIAGISAYILTSYQKNSQSLEAALKYIITGAIASIFLLFSIILLYLYTGSLNLGIIAQNFHNLSYNIQLLISILFLIGFGFKVEIFPFNFWVVDIYEGSTPLVNTLFSAIVVKAYLFVFFHIFYLFLPHVEISIFLIYMGAFSMIVAELSALKQTNLKRILAYSSLGQIALIFGAFALQNKEALEGVFFLVIAHSIAKTVLFLSLQSIEKQITKVEDLPKLHSPFLKTIMLISLLSLLGIPLFAGFIGKFLVLKSFAVTGMIDVIIIFILASFIEAIYYFKIIGLLMKKSLSYEVLFLSPLKKSLLVFLTLLIITIGIFPISISAFIHESATSFLDIATYIKLQGL